MRLSSTFQIHNKRNLYKRTSEQISQWTRGEQLNQRINNTIKQLNHQHSTIPATIENSQQLTTMTIDSNQKKEEAYKLIIGRENDTPEKKNKGALD